MRRLSKKGKGGANESVKEPNVDDDAQGNGTADFDEVSDDAGKSSKRGRKSDAPVSYNEDDARIEDSDEDDKPLSSKGKKSKKGKKSHPKDSKPKKPEPEEENDEEAEEEEYEVEEVVDSKLVKGVKYYRIRWKGYSADKDTWEPEGDLSCPELIKKFLAEHPEPEKSGTKTPSKKTPGKKRSSNVSGEPKAKREKTDSAEDVGEASEKEYEVEKIVEVHFKKNGEREFLIRWKGFSGDDDTWEPEANLDCPDLIEKFMKKVEKAKSVTERDLRVNPQATKRFTLATNDTGRRLSRRHVDRQRATYHNSE